MNKVFGIGWAKTGTTTLGKCFEMLGFDHQSQRLDLVRDIKEKDLRRIMSIARQKESFEDWPWISLFRELDREFPDSKFVLTIRDEERWLKSYRRTLEKRKRAADELNEIRRILYGLPFPDVTDEQLLARYDDHNRQVVDYFADRPDSLLIVNWERGHGWERLCRFLDKPVPSEPFPHENKGRYGRTNIFRRLLDKIAS